MAVPAPAEIDLQKTAGILWRGKWLLGLCALVGLMLGLGYLHGVATPVFTASSTVALESRQEQIVDIESVVSGLSGDQVAINTEVEVLRSRRLVGQLVDALNLTDDPEFNTALHPVSPWSPAGFLARVPGPWQGDAPAIPLADTALRDSVIDAVLAQVSVSNIRQSYVFQITARSPDPANAAAIANQLAELYVADQIALKFEKTVQATTWLTDRVAELQIALEEAEDALKAFSSDTNLISPEGLVGLNRQLKDMRDRAADLGAGLVSVEARLATVNGNGPTQTRLQAERDRLAAQSAMVAATITDLSTRIATQSDELVTLQQLQREAEASRLIYEFFLNRLKETSVQQGLQQAESRILSAAVVPLVPATPRVPMVLGLAMSLAGFAGVMMLLLREIRQNTFRTPEDLNNGTGYPVIGQIPLIPARNRSKVFDYLLQKPNSAAAEAVRDLRTSLLLSNIDRPPKVIMSTSSVPGEGKTTQSVALAINLGGLGKRVLLVEGDVRRRSLSTALGLEKAGGYLSVLLGNAKLQDVVVPHPEMGIDVLPSERSKGNAADIFASERFGALIQDMRQAYDYVIIDTPPVLAVTDARIIGRWADTTIYSVRWDSTSARQVAEGLRILRQVNVTIGGLVLGQISAKGMRRYGYRDSYGIYGSYYHE